MNNSIKILIILISITIIMICLLMGFLFFIKSKNKRSKSLEDLGRKLALERMNQIDTTISRVKLIIRENKNYESIFNEMEDLYTKINNMLSAAKLKIEDLSYNGKLFSKKEFSSEISNLATSIEKINLIEKKFSKVSYQIIQQDDFLTQEHVFYSSKLREVVEIYRNKRLLLNKISSNLDAASQKIKDTSKSFKKNLEIANNKAASNDLKNYAKYIIGFAEAVSKAPKIESYLYSIIPKIILELTESYKKKREEISAPLSHINFKESLVQMSKLFLNAKMHFKNLNMDKSISIIKKILKSVKILEKLMNSEISARNLFISKYEEVVIQIKISLTNFTKIKKQIKKSIGEGVSIDHELTSLMNDSQAMSYEVDSLAVKLRDAMRDKSIPYSSKLARMKSLMQKNIIFIGKMNEVLKFQWSLNVEKSIIKNKFIQSETAINEVLANLNSFDVEMSLDEKINYEKIELNINDLSIHLENDNINKDVKSRVDSLSSNVSSFYQAVNGNIQIAEITKNLIKELSPQRGINSKLNITLNSAEKLFLEGDYSQSLNIIINEMERNI